MAYFEEILADRPFGYWRLGEASGGYSTMVLGDAFPQAYWRFNEPSGNTFVDTTGHGRDATSRPPATGYVTNGVVSAGSTTMSVHNGTGAFGNGRSFVMAGREYLVIAGDSIDPAGSLTFQPAVPVGVTIPNGTPVVESTGITYSVPGVVCSLGIGTRYAEVLITNPFTFSAPGSIELWIKPTVMSAGGYGAIIQDAANGFGLWLQENAVGGGRCQVAWFDSLASGWANTLLLPGTLYHIVMTVDAAGVLTWYINGALVTDVTPSADPVQPTLLDRIAGVSYSPDGLHTLLLDELAVYQYVLSAAQVAAHYAFNVSITDSSGHARHAVPHDGILLGFPGAIADDTAAQFDGVSGYAATSGIPFGVAATGAFSFESWMKPGALGAYGEAVSTQFAEAVLGKTSGNRFWFGRNGAGGIIVSGATIFNTTTFYHVVGTYDGSQLRLYVNGVLDAGPSGWAGFVNPHGNVNIGRDVGYGEYFKGVLDEVAVYDYALTPSQVALHYALRTPATLVYIDGVERQGLVNWSSLNIDQQLGSRKVAHFTVDDPDGLYAPVVGNAVLIYNRGEREFYGSIEETTRTGHQGLEGSIRLITAVSCTSREAVLDRHLVSATYENQTLGAIVRDIVANNLLDEQISDAAVDDGPVIAIATFPYISITEAFNDLKNLTGYSFWIDDYSVLHFRSRDSLLASYDLNDLPATVTRQVAGGGSPQVIPVQPGPYLITVAGAATVTVSYLTGDMVAIGGTISTAGKQTVHTFTVSGAFIVSSVRGSAWVRDFAIRQTRQDYRNRQFMRAGVDVTTVRSEQFRGDNTRQTFNVEYPVALVPSVTVTGLSSYPAEIILDVPEGYWRLNEGGGTVAADSGPSGFTGTISGGVTLGVAVGPDGVQGSTCMAFNGTTGKIVTPAITLLPIAGVSGFTMEGWVKTASLATQPIWSNQVAGTGVLFGLTSGCVFLENGPSGAGGPTTRVVGSLPLNDNAWHFVAAINDGTNTSLFVDGVLRSAAAQPYPLPVSHAAALGWDANSGTFFNGGLDEVAVYRHVITVDRLRLHYSRRSTVQTVGIRSVEDNKSWYWNKNVNEISQDAIYTPLTTAQTITVTYQGMFPILVEAQNDAEVASRKAAEGYSGVYEAIEQDATVESGELAMREAEGYLSQYGYIKDVVTYWTERSGLHVGQIQTITSAKFGISGTAGYLLTGVSLHGIAEWPGMRYSVTAISGYGAGGWVEFFQNLFAATRQFQIRENEVLLTLRRQTETLVATDTTSYAATLVTARVGFVKVGLCEVA